MCICGLMPEQLMDICPKEFEMMRDGKIAMMKITNPYLSYGEQSEIPSKQSPEEQMQMISMANMMMGGS